ncbi:MAG: sensor histidine kinase, partial [Anaerolineales bacterium]
KSETGKIGMQPPKNDQLRRVNLIRFVLPFVLFVVVASYETWEHWLLEGSFAPDIHLNLEVLFFGILGPMAVFSVLSYVLMLLKKQVAVSTELEALNKTLEEKVAKRTGTLATRNAELAQANDELQKLDQLKSDFVSLVSHELRGPLTTLNGGLELALENAEQLPPEARRILTVMSRESQRLTEFVKTILDVSRLEAGKMVPIPGLVALIPLLKHSTEVVWARNQRQVQWDIPSILPLVWADENYLEEIFYNLLSNADKYSPPGTPIEISAHRDNTSLQITVTDHGPGIPSRMQSEIFKRFQRIERGDRITTKGWGLGLYFARSLAEAQGGGLTVQSPVRNADEGPGSAFTVTIPIASEIPEDA